MNKNPTQIWMKIKTLIQEKKKNKRKLGLSAKNESLGRARLLDKKLIRY